jgi:hypothetical protein
LHYGRNATGKRALNVTLEQGGKRLLGLPFGVLWTEGFRAVDCKGKLDVYRLLDPRVPSLSKVAILSASGTKSGEPCFVTRSTNVTIAFFDAVSFHDGSGSPATSAKAAAGRNGNAGSAVKVDSIARRFIPKGVSPDFMVSSS